MRRFLLALCPRQWRARYGDEFAALLRDTPLTLAAVVDVLRLAMRLHLRARPWLAQIAGAVLATAAMEAAAVRAELTDNILWAPSTPLRALALVAVLTPTAMVVDSAAMRRARLRGDELA
ncbi:hypothetical protein [Parafrankia sp. BMG5.11]|uniref:hypothetical protein n=1 Tax=Parafrankia sp. BMG5.11 TaxID=222540 RepID=UPI0010392A1F|nr:hypothetical protein [Parafrankia sp. BMG5.11]TCJ33378.1 hypothetical protein E0504_37655 [Parafrankia sp. BMG5.11]CAI7974206.1 conserved hypothetical protein [Frankia sp. Hr75.2]